MASSIETVRLAAAAEVVDGCGARAAMEGVEGADDVAAVDVVAHLLALVAEDRVRRPGDRAAHQVGQEAVQLGARVLRARSGSRRGSRPSASRSSVRTPGPSGRRRPSRRRTASASSGRSTSPCRCRRTSGDPPVAPSGSRARPAAARWACRRRPCWWTVKMNVASGACSRAASSRFSVPSALTPKSVCGSRAAQSCDGCAAVWMTSSIRAVPANRPSIAVGVADVESTRGERVELALQPRRHPGASRPRRRRSAPACRCRCRRRRSRARRSGGRTPSRSGRLIR